jgi:Spy/CpxP family protein refolding chaperone
MNHLEKAVMITVASTLLLGVAPFTMADDSATAPQLTTNQQMMMKECMKKQKAANNGMSEADMKKSCRDQIKANVDTPSASAEPVVPAH